jgi:hypothetical protein
MTTFLNIFEVIGSLGLNILAPRKLQSLLTIKLHFSIAEKFEILGYNDTDSINLLFKYFFLD